MGLNRALVFCVLAFMAGVIFISYSQAVSLAGKVEALAGENERLRLFNAREARRHQLHKNAPAPRPAEELVEMARHLTGCSPDIVRGVYIAENGPPDIETGVLGKTDFYAANLPMRYWPAVEAGRTMNIYAWSWLTKTADGRRALKQILAYAAGPYTQVSPERQKQWVENIMAQVKKVK